MRWQSGARVAFAILLVLSCTSWVHAEVLPNSAIMLIQDAELSPKRQQYLRTPVDSRTEQADSQLLSPSEGDSALRGNCIVSSKREVRNPATGIRPSVHLGENEHLWSVRLTKRHASHLRPSHHTPLLLFRCNFGNPDSRLEAVP